MVPAAFSSSFIFWPDLVSFSPSLSIWPPFFFSFSFSICSVMQQLVCGGGVLAVAAREWWIDYGLGSDAERRSNTGWAWLGFPFCLISRALFPSSLISVSVLISRLAEKRLLCTGEAGGGDSRRSRVEHGLGFGLQGQFQDGFGLGEIGLGGIEDGVDLRGTG